jgi:hypothetical protein
MATLLVAALALLIAVLGAAAVGPVRNGSVAPWNNT